VKSRLNNHNLPPVPPWDEIIARTDADLRAERFLENCGLKIEIKYQAPSRYRATIHRGHKSFSLTLPADTVRGIVRRPTAYDALTTVLIRGAMKPNFERRVRTFFGKRELEELEGVL
jgi:hypothetical protein